MKIKINYMKTESNPSDDEIRSYMNFDKLIEGARRKTEKQWLRRIWIALPIGLALLSLWLVMDNMQQVKQAPEKTNSESPEASALDDDSRARMQRNEKGVEKKVTDSKKAPASNQQTEADQAKERRTSADKISASKSDIEEDYSNAEALQKEAPLDAPLLNQTVVVAKDTYIQAEPRSGYRHLYKYFEEHLLYPPEAIRDSVEGIETVSFTIDENGRATNIAITQSLGRYFDQEAIRLISGMPAWQPATLNGRPVASQLSVPITFQLRRIKKP